MIHMSHISYIVLQQASQVCCVSGMGAIVPIISQLIFKKNDFETIILW